MNKKTAIILSTFVAILSLVACIFIISGEMSQRQQGTCIKVIDTKDTADDGTFSVPYKVKQSGHYKVRVNFWPEEDPGVLTGFYLNDKNDNCLVGATAQKLLLESKSFYIEKGEYKLNFQIITNNDEFFDFYNAHLLNDFEYIPWDGFKDTNMSIDYEVIFERSTEDYLPILYLLCGVFGMAMAFITITLLIKGKTVKCDYDERMRLNRYKSESQGFISMLVALGVFSLITSAGTDIHIEASVLMTFAFMLGVTVSAVGRIIRDGYFALNENKTGYIIIFIFTDICTFAFAIYNFVKERVLVNGTISNGVVPAFLFLMLTAILIAIVYKEKTEIEED